jgi:hypothetical protein
VFVFFLVKFYFCHISAVSCVHKALNHASAPGAQVKWKFKHNVAKDVLDFYPRGTIFAGRI